MADPLPQSDRPDPQGGHPELEADEARQAVMTGHLRWVLVISLVLTTLALILAGVWFSTTSPNPHQTPPSAAAHSA